MNNDKLESVKLLDIQMLATVLFFGSLILSYLISYNDKINILYNKRIFTGKQAYYIDLFNRFLLVGIFFVIYYVNLKNKEMAQKSNKDLTPFNLQISASEIIIVAVVIVLYSVITYPGANIAATENPGV